MAVDAIGGVAAADATLETKVTSGFMIELRERREL